MKVCLLNESFPPVLDGVANVVMNYASYMTGFGAEVEVGTPRYPEADYSSYPYKVVPYQSFDTAAVASGYRAGNPLAGKEVSELAEFQPDIIHAHCPASATVIARILREQTQAPVVFTYHTKYDVDIERWVKIKAISQEAVKAMVSNIEACDEVWVVSRGAGESLKALGFSGEYRVMNNGVDFEKGRIPMEKVREVTAGYDLPEGIPMFLFVGRLMSYKGIPLILDALKIVADQGQDFRMVLIGKGPDREMLEEQAKNLGIAEKCIFVGPVYDREALRAWNTRADLFLFPSTFDTNGLVVREAAACGLASVLIRNSCAAEGITDGQNGFIIDENAESMAELLTRISGDLSYLYEVGQHAMDEIYMSWADCVQEAYHRYEELLEMKKNGRLESRKKNLTDLLLSAAAKNMEERAYYRQLQKELFHDFKDTATGMMENMQDAEERVESSMERLRERMKNNLDEAKQSIRDKDTEIKQSIRDRQEEMRLSLQETRDSIEQFPQKMKENLQETRDSIEQFPQKVKENLQETRDSIEQFPQTMKENLQEMRDKVTSYVDKEEESIRKSPRKA